MSHTHLHGRHNVLERPGRKARVARKQARRMAKDPQRKLRRWNVWAAAVIARREKLGPAQP